MPEMQWTPRLVEERLVEAADVLKQLPEPRVQGYFSLWPKILYDFSDLVGQEPGRTRRPPPSPQAISRMEETLDWTKGLDPVDSKIVWLRASGKRWKSICWEVGLTRAAAHQHWLYALCVITWRLNGRRVPAKWSRSHAIATIRIVAGSKRRGDQHWH
jgi:hypothetical protein